MRVVPGDYATARFRTAYLEVVATANVAGGQFQMRHVPQERILKRAAAEIVVNAAQGFEGALAVRVENKRQGPPLPPTSTSTGPRLTPSRNKRQPRSRK